MPGPGIDDVDFDRPTTGRKRPRQRRRALLKLPVEFAEFRLSDGRALGEVMGDEFFGPASGAGGGRPISKSVRALLREGNSPLSGIIRKNPETFSPPVTGSGIFNRDSANTRTGGKGRWKNSVRGIAEPSPLVLANAGEFRNATNPEMQDNPAARILDAASLDEEGFAELLMAIAEGPRLSRLQRTQLANLAHTIRTGELTGEDIPTALRMTGAWLRPPDPPKLPDPSQPEDTAGETTRKLIENTPSMFKQIWGGLMMSRAESDGPMDQLEEEFLKNKLSSPNEAWRKLAEKVLANREKERESNFAYGAELFSRATQDLMDNAPNVDPESLKGYGYDIGAAFVQMVPAVGTTLASKGRTSAGMAVLGTQVYGQKYGEARTSGRTDPEARQDATFYALTEAIPERIPLGILMKQGTKFLPRLSQTMAAEGVQEMFTEILQSGYDAGILDEEMTWGEAWDRIKRAGIVGSFVGGGTATATHPFVGSERQRPNTAQSVETTSKDSNIGQLSQTAAQAPVNPSQTQSSSSEFGERGQQGDSRSTTRQYISSLVNFVQQFGADRKNRRKPGAVRFGPISTERAQEIADQIKQDLGIEIDLQGAVHKLDEDAVAKTIKKHGRDQVPFSPEDFELIPDVVEFGDIVPPAKKTRSRELPGILFRLQIGDWFYVVEEVQKKGRVLSIQTAYKKRGPKAQP